MKQPQIPSSFRRNAMAVSVLMLTLLFVPCIDAAEPGPVGAEFQVNRYIGGSTRISGRPAVAADADGDFVVAWANEADGDFEILARRYNAAGAPQGSQFHVNNLFFHTQASPAIALDSDGDFVVAWESSATSDTDNFEIRARRFNAAGVPLGSEFKVSAGTAGDQHKAKIAVNADGDFAVVWETSSNGKFDIHARRFTAAGVGGKEFLVNTVTAGDQIEAAIAAAPDGDFVVAWTSDAIGDGNFDIHARRYDAAGIAGDEFRVNGLTAGSQRGAHIAATAAGDFVVAWTNSPPGGGADIRARRFSAAGVARGGEFQVSTLTTGRQVFADVAADADGDFVIAWTNLPDSGGADIRARRYSAAGVAIGGEVQVNDKAANYVASLLPGIAADADGDFVVAWLAIAANDDIRARRFQGPDPVNLVLFQTDSADPAPVGSPLTYTLNASNLRTPGAPTTFPAINRAIGLATGLSVVDTVPAGSTAISASGVNWACTLPAGKVNCDYALPLRPSEEASPLTVTITPPSTPGVAITNVGDVAANQFDDDRLNNRDVERTRLVCPKSVIQLSSSAYTVSEAVSSATITATRSGSACGTASVQFDTAADSAQLGQDFVDVTGTLTWADGDLADKTFTIPIINDTLDEISERVVVNLSDVQGASLGARRAARLAITDDDPTPRVGFTSDRQALAEAPALAKVNLVLSRASGRDVIVPLSYGGTATSGADYAAGPTALTIPAGQISAATQIKIIGDTADEPDEKIVIRMGAVVGAEIGSVSAHTITIIDDDVSQPSVSFDTASASQNEAKANTVRVRLSNLWTQTVTVPYTRSGTATFNSDYKLSLGSPITFNPGQTEKLIVITPVNDNLDEPNERVVLTLTAPTGATLGAITSHQRVIVDNNP